jgi:WD40 repeat protein
VTAAEPPALIAYRAGSEFGPLGRFELTVDATGAAALRHRHDGLARAWSASVDPIVWTRLVDALRRSDFPRTPPLGRPGVRVQELAVSGVEPAGELWMRWGDGAAVGLTDALRILDSLVHQVGNGAVPGTESVLPWVVHAVTAEQPEPPVPVPVAVFGDLDGPVGATVHDDGRVTLLAATDGSPRAELAATGVPVRSVAFARIGSDALVATGGDDGLLRLWTAGGAPLAAQVRHTAPVRALTATVDEDPLVVWSADLAGGLHQRGLVPGRPVLRWPGEEAGITALGWARAGGRQVLVAGSADGRIGCRPVDDPDASRSWAAHSGAVDAVAVIGADDDFLIASGGADHAIRVRAGVAGTERAPLAGHKATVSGLAFGLIGDRLVLGSCGLDGTVRTWDPATGGLVAAWSARDDWPCGLADAAAGGVQRWATGSADGAVRIWDAATGTLALNLRPGARSAGGDPAGVLAVATALLPGRTLVAAGYGDGTFRVWDALDGTLLGVDGSAAEPLTSVEFGRDGTGDVFVCGTAAGSVRVYDPASAALRQVLTPHTDQVLAVAAGPRGMLASGSADRTVRVWDGRTGWPLHCLTGHTDLVTAVAFGRAGAASVVVSGGYDRTVRAWDTGSGAPLVTLDGARSAVYALAVGAAGGRSVVAAGGYDDAVRVFDLESGTWLLATEPVAGFVRALAIGVRDGREIVVAAAGDAVRCWSLPDGAPLWTVGCAHPPLVVGIGPRGEIRTLGAGGLTTVDP